MPTNNPWLTPFQRSYQSIKAKLQVELRARVPELTDMSEGNIFIILVSIFAAIAETIHYYMDNMAREAFLPTARRFSSVYKHAKLVDYHIKSAHPASVDITLYRSNGLPISSDISIPIDTLFTSTDGKPWYSSKTILWPNGTYSIKVPVVQKSPIGNTGAINLGTITTEDAIIYLGDLPSGNQYVEGSMVLTIDDQPWQLVDTFAYSNSESLVYKVEIDENGFPYIVFGDGLFGKKPALTGSVSGYFYITTGAAGNIPPASFNVVPQNLMNIQSDLVIYNQYAASGGTNYETFQMIKDHIPLSIKTLGVAITKDDYEAKAMTIAGVDKAYCNYICGKFVEIYLTPDNGGEASQALLDQVYDELAKSKVITTTISVKSTHTAKVFIQADIWAKPSFNNEDVSNQVNRALVEAYNYNTSNINRPVRLSDIYSLIDNQSMVDYLKLTKLYILPYSEPVNNDQSQPDINITAFEMNSFSAVDELDYETFTIQILGAGYQIIDSEGTSNIGSFGSSLNVNSVRTSFNITINTPQGAVYHTGDEYRLIVQPMNTDIIPHGYNIPIISPENITLTIHETV